MQSFDDPIQYREALYQLQSNPDSKKLPWHYIQNSFHWDLYYFNDIAHCQKLYNALNLLQKQHHEQDFPSTEERQQALDWLLSLGYKDFSDTDLYFLDLSNTGLSDASFMETGLCGTNFSGCHLKGANFSGAFFHKTSMFSAQLQWADFSWASLHWVDFREADLSNTCFAESRLTPKQLSICGNIEKIWGLSERFLQEVQELNTKLLKWWDGKSREITWEQWLNIKGKGYGKFKTETTAI